MTAALAFAAVQPDLLGTSPADLLPDERHDSTPTEARERADRLRAGIVRYAEMRQDIADAFACRDWLALGYQHWAAYVEAEFGEQLAQLARGERRQAIGDLREQGMSTRQIASATGVDPKTVRNDLSQVGTNSPPEKVVGSDGKSYAPKRPEPKPTPTPGPVAAEAPAPVAGPGSTSPMVVSGASSPTPDPATKTTLRLAPDPDQIRAAEQRDARALLSRGVDLLAPRRWKAEHIQSWIERMGSDDEELAELKRRAEAAIAVLHRIIEEAGQ